MKGKNQDETKISQVVNFKDAKNKANKEVSEKTLINKTMNSKKSKGVIKIKDVEKQRKINNLKNKKNEKKINKDNSKKTKKKLDSFDIASSVVIGLLVWAGISLSFNFIEQQMEISVLNERKLAIEKQIKQEQKELKKVQNTLKQLDTLEFVEKQAREKLGMIKPGETVYIDLTKKKN